MSQFHPDLPEFIHAISESSSLSRAIIDIYDLPLPLRTAALSKIISEMSQNKEDQELIGHLFSLRDPVIFDAVFHALSDHDDEAEQDAAANP